MKQRLPAPRRMRRQNGYALLLVIFLTMLVTLGTIVAAPAVRTERQREKEEEMIWRGKQYIRGIKLYYRKNGRFPTSLEDLTKPKNGSLRYLRQAYKDPMNKEDGAWRLIYVGPSGQLIGSLKPPQTLQFSGAGGPQGTPAAGAGLGAFGQQPQQGTTPGQPGQPTTGLAPIGLGTTPGTPGAPGTAQTTGTGPGDSGSFSTPTSLSPSDSPTSIIGGNIIGVGSKRDKASVIIYEKAKNYHLFEFIWDPSKDTMAIGGTGTQVGTPNAPGQGIDGPGQGFGQPAGQGPGGFGSQGGFGTQPGNNPMQPTTPPLSNPPQQP